MLTCEGVAGVYTSYISSLYVVLCLPVQVSLVGSHLFFISSHTRAAGHGLFG